MKKTAACSLVGHLFIYLLLCLARHIEDVDALALGGRNRNGLDVSDDYALLLGKWAFVAMLLTLFGLYLVLFVLDDALLDVLYNFVCMRLLDAVRLQYHWIEFNRLQLVEVDSHFGLLG